MSRKHHAERLPTTDDLLAGRAQPTATALLHAIHAENPTGRGLPRAQEERRYERKARLQSLLVRVHGDDLIVRADPRDEGVVTLVHRDLEADACHASIEALDDDARVWVRTRLAMGDQDEHDAEARARRERQASEAPPDADTIEGALESAEEALDAYDYESARSGLESALRAWPDDPRPAVALLELLVDVLALDDDAIALQLSKRARTSLTVRRKLAIASSRVALARGDVAEADRHLRDAESLGPDEVAESVRAEIERVRGDARAEAERALEQALQALGQDWQQAIAKASAFLERWPDSAIARRAIRDAEGRLLDAAAEQARTEAEAAEARGDLERALVVLRDVGAKLADQSDRRELASALRLHAARIEAELLRQANEARVARVVEHLEERCDADALLAYASLDASSREAVRRRIDRPELGWAEAVHAIQPRRAAVDAVLALARATELAERSPEHAAAALASHRQALAEVPEATAIFRRAEALEREARLRAAREALAAARVAYEADRMEDARRAIAAVRVADLAEGDREAHRALATAIERRSARDDRIAAYRSARAGERWFEARRALLSLVSEHADDPGLALEAERAAVEREIARAFQVSIEHGAWPLGDGFDLEAARAQPEDPQVSLALDEDGPRVALVDLHAHFVFVQIVDVARREVVTRLRLRAPSALAYADHAWDGRTLVIAGAGVLVVRTDSGVVEAWHALRWDEHRRWDGTTLAPDGNHAWVRPRVTNEGESVEVVDVRTARVVRRVRAWHLHPSPGPSPRIVACVDQSLTVFDARGAASARMAGEGIHDAIPLPSGDGWLVIGGLHAEDEEPPLFVHRGGPLRRVGSLEGSWGSAPLLSVTVDDTMLLWFHTEDGAILSFRQERGDEVVELSRVDAPSEGAVFVDPRARRAFAIWPTDTRVELMELRADAALPRPSRPLRRVRPSTRPSCGSRDEAAPDARVLEHVARGELDAARAALAEVVTVTASQRAHAEHLRAILALLDGDGAGARAAIERGEQEPGALCDFDALSTLATIVTPRDPASAPPDPSEADDEAELARLLEDLARADSALDAGDPSGALAALGARESLAARDVQILARRVAAHLALGDRARPPPFDVARVLAAYGEVMDDPFARDLLIPRGKWWTDRLAGLALEAQAWLDVGPRRAGAD